MRVLSVIHYPVPGGPHNRNRVIEPILREQGIELVLLVPDDCANVESLRADGMHVVTMPLTRLRATLNPREQLATAAGFWRDVAEIRKLIRAQSIDVVLINGFINPHAGLAARAAGVPVVWQLLDTRTPRPAIALLMPLVRRLASVMMTTGMEVARLHPGAMSFGEKLVSFWPPVDLKRFRPPEPELRAKARATLNVDQETFLFGTVANINSQKGHEFTLRAVASLRRRGLPVDVRLIGASSSAQMRYERGLRSEAAALGFDKEIIIDPRGAVAELLPGLDAFVLSSRRRSEGIPTAVLEAMACAVPVVATDVGAVREAVVHGETGLVVAPDDTEAMAEALFSLYDDPQMRKALASEALARTYRFTAQECATRHSDAFALAFERPS